MPLRPAQDEDEDDHAHEDEAHDGHDHGDEDPHVWLDPTAMVALTEAVADRLADLAPEHAAEFAANADQLVAELTALDEELTTGLAELPHPHDRHQPRRIPVPR